MLPTASQGTEGFHFLSAIVFAHRFLNGGIRDSISLKSDGRLCIKICTLFLLSRDEDAHGISGLCITVTKLRDLSPLKLKFWM
jgi:hypothetical protein